MAASGMVAACWHAPAAAETPAPDDRSGPATEIIAEPYLWVPSVTGTVRIGALQAPLDVHPRDFADGLKFGVLGRVKAQRRDTFVYSDFIIIDYDNDRFKPFFRQPLIAQLDYVEFGVGRNFDIALPHGRTARLSPHIGAQYLRLESSVNGDIVQANASGRWFAVLIGVEGHVPLSRKFGIDAAVGATGAGDRRYRSASAALSYRLARNWRIDAGYRIASGRYTTSDALSVYLRGHGPTASISYRFAIN